MFDMKLFVDTDADTRLARRGRNLVNNSYSLTTILELFPVKIHRTLSIVTLTLF